MRPSGVVYCDLILFKFIRPVNVKFTLICCYFDILKYSLYQQIFGV